MADMISMRFSVQATMQQALFTPLAGVHSVALTRPPLICARRCSNFYVVLVANDMLTGATYAHTPCAQCSVLHRGERLLHDRAVPRQSGGAVRHLHPLQPPELPQRCALLLAVGSQLRPCSAAAAWQCTSLTCSRCLCSVKSGAVGPQQPHRS